MSKLCYHRSMERTALHDLKQWWRQTPVKRKPLIVRGARQVGKSFLVRDFCLRQGLNCFEINFEKEPGLRRLFVEGDNSRTISLLEPHFGEPLDSKSVLFLDEIQAAPEVFSRLRYFYEDTPEIAVMAAGSLLEFSLAELQYSVPVGRIEYLYLGPMRFEEFLKAQGEESFLKLLKEWDPKNSKTMIPDVFHEKLLSFARDFSFVGGMPESIARFTSKRDFLEAGSAQRSIIETYREDFSKYRKRIPIERLEKVFDLLPSQVGKKWVHARINPHEKAHSIEIALEALCKARVAQQVFHSSGNGVPLRAERKDNLYKVLFLDVGLMGNQLGLRIKDLVDPSSLIRVNEGSLAEQWIGQHLLDLRTPSQTPELSYWVREKTGSLAEVDYLFSHGPFVIPVKVKAGPSTKAQSLQVFLSEKKKSPVAVHFSLNPAEFDPDRKILSLPFYLIEQLPRILDSLI